MWTLIGCVFLGAVLWYWLRRISRMLHVVAIVFERIANRAAMRNGGEPITTPEDEAQFR